MNIFKGLILTLLLISLFVWLSISFADPPLPTPIGRVIWVKGTLKAVMSNKEVRILEKMSVVYLHDVLITEAQSEAQVTFTDNSSITFYPSTKFIVDKYSFVKKKQGGSVGRYVANLIEGGFRTITGLIAKSNPSDYQVNTPVATIGVRGTDYAAFMKGGQLYIGYYTGKPCVTSKNKSGELCLSDALRYAYVPSANVAPVPLSEQPDVFKETLLIVPTTISPFGPTSQNTPQQSGGVITSFCISQ